MKKPVCACVLTAVAVGVSSFLWQGVHVADLQSTAYAGERSVTSAAIPATALASAVFAAADEYGTLTGQYVLDGDIPQLPPKVKKGDAGARDPAVCAANDVPDDSLVVDPATKGIANVFVYLQKASKVHPELKESKDKDVIFDQKGCRFIPHTLLVRTDQVVQVKSDDPISHNTRTSPIRQPGANETISPNNRKGVPFTLKTPEGIPTQVECSIHPWMKAYWLVLDHPYAAITGTDGKFKIEKLPAGDHEFTIWQENKGYIARKLKVTIKPGETTDLGTVKVPVAGVTPTKK